MRKGSTLFLKVVIGLMATGALAIMLWFPQVEGRNANSDWLSLYFNDPFLAYVYAGFVPFFIALYQAFKLLTYIEQNKTFSQDSIKVLRNIKYCAMTIILFLVGALILIRIFAGEQDDPAGPTAVGMVVIFATAVIATFAAVLQKLFQNALDIKSENELTV
jgi:hypothetical protein